MAVIKVPEVRERQSPDRGGFALQAFAWAVSRLLPKGSPDYDVRLPLVSYWLVELDEDNWATREIGFTAQHDPVLFAPTTRNLGLWTDSDRVFSRDEFEARDDFPFDTAWNQLLKSSGQVPL